ncbi:hypothetical protein KRIGEM_02949 (plasmid) [Komagataeibacter rhaeticus]|mgnify:CR=1 FL=1|nr:hypothetical protein [Acetobacter syzygii]SAY49960.1 hypothetical protein KRIGEM_02949 [Komagataeibacter rhaeticus]
MRLYRLKHTENGVCPVLDEAPDPSPVPGEVLVKIQAASVNYRDLLLLGDPAMTEGVLQDYVSVPARSLIAKPEYLSFAEAATLPCARPTRCRGHRSH